MSAEGRKRSSAAGIAALCAKYGENWARVLSDMGRQKAQRVLRAKLGPDWKRVLAERGRERQREIAEFDPSFHSRRAKKAAATIRERYGKDWYERRAQQSGFNAQKGRLNSERGLEAMRAKYGPDFRRVVGARSYDGRIKKHGLEGAERQAKRVMRKARDAQTPEMRSELGRRNGRRLAEERPGHFKRIAKRGGLLTWLKHGAVGKHIGKARPIETYMVSVETALAVLDAVPSPLHTPRGPEEIASMLEVEVTVRQVERALALLRDRKLVEHTTSDDGAGYNRVKRDRRKA